MCKAILKAGQLANLSGKIILCINTESPNIVFSTVCNVILFFCISYYIDTENALLTPSFVLEKTGLKTY